MEFELAFIHCREAPDAVETEAEEQSRVERDTPRVTLCRNGAHDMAAPPVQLVERVRAVPGSSRPEPTAVPTEGCDRLLTLPFLPQPRKRPDPPAVRRFVASALL